MSTHRTPSLTLSAKAHTRKVPKYLEPILSPQRIKPTKEGSTKEITCSIPHQREPPQVLGSEAALGLMVHSLGKGRGKMWSKV